MDISASMQTTSSGKILPSKSVRCVVFQRPDLSKCEKNSSAVAP